MASKRKQDEKHLNILRAMVKLDHNKYCFDCNQRGPTYLNMTIGAFVCTSCSGLLRGLTPPQRVKSISMASFSPEEIEFIRSRGNEFCRKVWLGLHDKRNIDFLDKDENKIKDFMTLKYEKKRFYVVPTESMMEEAKQQNNPPKVEPQTKPIRSLGNHSYNSSAKPVISTGNTDRLQPSQTKNVATSGQKAVQPSSITQPPTKAGAVDLLSELGSDPFAGTYSHQQGFADFGSFGNAPQSHMAHSVSQPGGFPANHFADPAGSVTSANPAPAAQLTQSIPPPIVQSNSFGAFLSPLPSAESQAVKPEVVQSAADKYSALAELDTVFGGGPSGSKTVNWDSSNPFSSNTPIQQTGNKPAGNPFAAENAFATSFGMNQTSDFAVPFNTPASNANQTSDFAVPFTTPANNVVSMNTQMGVPSSNFSNGRTSIEQQQQMWQTDLQRNTMNMRNINIGANYPASGQLTQPPRPQYPTPMDKNLQQPPINPFMNIASQQSNQPLNSTNPFL